MAQSSLKDGFYVTAIELFSQAAQAGVVTFVTIKYVQSLKIICHV